MRDGDWPTYGNTGQQRGQGRSENAARGKSKRKKQQKEGGGSVNAPIRARAGVWFSWISGVIINLRVLLQHKHGIMLYYVIIML
jgi:hypothetical protein